MTLDEIRQLIDGATPGPWVGQHYCVLSESCQVTSGGITLVADCFSTKNGREEANARFIAASRMLLPVLLEVVALAKECGNATSHEVFPPLSSRLRQALAALEALKLP